MLGVIPLLAALSLTAAQPPIRPLLALTAAPLLHEDLFLLLSLQNRSISLTQTAQLVESYCL